jgi:hypothetical protein
MTPQEIVKQGLEAAKDEDGFRKWASLWFPGIVETIGAKCPWTEPLEVCAFQAREMAGYRWKEGVYLLFTELATGEWDRVDVWEWWGRDAAPYHWIIAGAIALEIQKKEKP